MDDSKVIEKTAIVAPFTPKRRHARRLKPIDLGNLAHQIANQLTVINLTCFKLNAALQNTEHPLHADIGRLQSAVEEMQSLVELLSHLEGRCQAVVTHPGRSRPLGRPHRAKIYPIAEAKRLDR